MSTRERVVGHITTKTLAVKLWLTGSRGAARVAWRWMANLPTEADLARARELMRQPRYAAEIAKLRERDRA